MGGLGQGVTAADTFMHRPGQIALKIGELGAGDMPCGVAALTVGRVIQGEAAVEDEQFGLTQAGLECVGGEQLGEGHGGRPGVR
ncbi:hypothetical protein D3C85_1589990 [compost metagenome]